MLRYLIKSLCPPNGGFFFNVLYLFNQMNNQQSLLSFYYTQGDTKDSIIRGYETMCVANYRHNITDDMFNEGCYATVIAKTPQGHRNGNAVQILRKSSKRPDEVFSTFPGRHSSLVTVYDVQLLSEILCVDHLVMPRNFTPEGLDYHVNQEVFSYLVAENFQGDECTITTYQPVYA